MHTLIFMFTSVYVDAKHKFTQHIHAKCSYMQHDMQRGYIFMKRGNTAKIFCVGMQHGHTA
jgi:hypothetical protein